MLKFLSIQNFALIDRLEIDFQAGFNLITGETGSGKSIVVDALGLLVGARASQEMVRQGSDKARVEGLFELSAGHPALRLLIDAGLADENGELVVRREISTSGANKVFVNGSLTTQTLLAEIGDLLVDIHGQHDHQTLLRASSHLEFLDAFGQNRARLRECGEVFRRLTGLRREIEQIRSREQQRLQELDLCRFQLEEIENLQLHAGLDTELEEERTLLSTAEKRLSLARDSYETLYEKEGAAVEELGRVEGNLAKLSALDAGLREPAKRLAELRFQLEEIAYQLRDYQETVEFNPERRQAVEDRLAEIQQAARKYGGSVESILTFAQELGPRIQALEQTGARGEKLSSEEKSLAKEYARLAEELSRKRGADAVGLQRSVEKELSDLAMEATVFRVRLESDPAHPREEGIDEAEFLISPNAGEDPRPLAKIASGGELSRVILALKSILTPEPYAKTLVFDEVDAGIGGRVAATVGRKLAALARRHQVFCVTHLPQIAGFASRHLHVSKEIEGKRTLVRVRHLDEAARIEELARMLAGDTVTDATRRHARELLRSG